VLASCITAGQSGADGDSNPEPTAYKVSGIPFGPYADVAPTQVERSPQHPWQA
jgi:hypothetical protein